MSRRCRSSPRWRGWPSRTSCRRPSGSPVAVALIRGLVRRRSDDDRELLGGPRPGPSSGCCFPSRSCSASSSSQQGMVQNFHGDRTVATVDGGSQTITGGPVASQEVIKEFGTNGGGFYNANASHPFENPNPLTDWVEILLLLAIPFALTYAFGRHGRRSTSRLGGLRRHVRAVGRFVAVATAYEVQRQPPARRVRRHPDGGVGAGGGKPRGERVEVRIAAASGLYAASTTGTSTAR